MRYTRTHTASIIALTVATLLTAAIAAAQPATAPATTPATAPAIAPITSTTGPLSEALSFRLGQDNAALLALDVQIRTAPAADRPAIEERLLATLADPQATPECLEFVCRELRMVGSAKSVPALAKLLPQEQVSHMACYALEGIGGPEPAAALREALPAVADKLKADLVHSLGTMGDAGAVGAIAPLTRSADADLARAAMTALGQIGTPEAAVALDNAESAVPEALKADLAHARLACADRLAANKGGAAVAVGIYSELFAKEEMPPFIRKMPPVIRIRALGGIATSAGDQAAPTVVEAINSDIPQVQDAAVAFAARLEQPAATKALTDALAKASPQVQVRLLMALQLRGDKSAAGAVAALVASPEPTVRMAAIETLGPLGDAAAIDVLLTAAAEAGPQRDAAAGSLALLTGPDVDATMLRLATSADDARKVIVIPVLATRQCREALPTLVTFAAGNNADVASASFVALGGLAGADMLPKLVELLAGAVDTPAGPTAVTAIRDVITRTGCQQAAGELLVGKYGPASPTLKCALLSLLARAAGEQPLAIVQAALTGDAALRDAAVRALADWPDAQAAPALLALANDHQDLVHSVLALRGYTRLANEGKGLDRAQRLTMFRQALAAAARPEDKKLILGSIGSARNIGPGALEVLSPYLADPEVNTEASAAAIVIAKIVVARNRDQVVAVMREVVRTCKDEHLVAQARAYTGQ